jgi:hypothetical protein
MLAGDMVPLPHTQAMGAALEVRSDLLTTLVAALAPLYDDLRYFAMVVTPPMPLHAPRRR